MEWGFLIATALLILLFALVSWDQQRKLKRAKDSVAEWKDIAMRAHATSKGLLDSLSAFSANLQALTIQQQIEGAKTLEAAFAPKVHTQGEDVVFQKMQDVARGFMAVELVPWSTDVDETGDGYNAG